MKTIKIETYAFPILDIGDQERMQLLQLFDLWDSQVYKFGGKSIGDDPNERAGNPKPIDCSGFFGMAIDRITQKTDTPTEDCWQLGSRQQYEKIKAAGFKVSSNPESVDNKIRSFHLLSEHSETGVGHIGFIINGYTIESCGSRGVARRKFDPNMYPFMGLCSAFVLGLPDDKE
jgi:hypothetical protein